MEEYFSLLHSVPLFQGIAQEELAHVLECLSAQRRCFQKGETIFHTGEAAESVGIVCVGAVHVVMEDFMGNRSIMAALVQGEVFGEAFACAGIEKMPVSAIAVANCEILLLNYRKIISSCGSHCRFHSQMIENMLCMLAQKNIALAQKVEIISKRSTREKLTAYLSAQAVHAGSRSFRIPFDRQGLADFLCIERSAMSAELSRMQQEGLLRTNRSAFELMQEF